MNNSTTSIGKQLSLLEKKMFPWRRSCLVPGQPAFFPGCNLVNFLPETAKEIIGVFEKLGAGWLYDCCGKPLRLSGQSVEAAQVLGRINRQLQAANVSELVVACPNCVTVFQDTLAVPVKDIYTFLNERNISYMGSCESLLTFPPCPDRQSGRMQKAIAIWAGVEVRAADNLPCCGLGIRNPAGARKAMDTILLDERALSPYCASCFGHLSKNGVVMKPHILTEGLGISERGAKGMHQALNRMKPWFWR